MAIDINTALAQLDPDNDEQWTADGLPRIDVVEAILGTKGLKRADITEAAPEFSRASAAEANSEEAEDEEAEEPAAEAEAAEATEDAAPATENEAEPAHQEDAAPAEEAQPVEAEAQPEQPISPELHALETELKEASDEMLEAQRAAEAAKKEADAKANRVNTLNRQIERLQKSDPNHGTAGIRRYLAQQNKNREERGRRLQNFVATTGVSPTEVAKALDPKAPIDKAMHGRKPPRGSTRPVFQR